MRKRQKRLKNKILKVNKEKSRLIGDSPMRREQKGKGEEVPAEETKSELEK